MAILHIKVSFLLLVSYKDKSLIFKGKGRFVTRFDKVCDKVLVFVIGANPLIYSMYISILLQAYDI
jgi:hypothetical protein